MQCGASWVKPPLLFFFVCFLSLCEKSFNRCALITVNDSAPIQNNIFCFAVSQVVTSTGPCVNHLCGADTVSNARRHERTFGENGSIDELMVNYGHFKPRRNSAFPLMNMVSVSYVIALIVPSPVWMFKVVQKMSLWGQQILYS